MGMCYFTGQDSPHLPDCGYVDLEAARRVANLDRNAAVSELTNWLVERLPITINAPMLDMVIRCADAVIDAALGVTTKDDDENS